MHLLLLVIGSLGLSTPTVRQKTAVLNLRPAPTSSATSTNLPAAAALPPQSKVSSFHSSENWCTYAAVNDVSGVHNSSIKRVDGVQTAAACQQHAVDAESRAYTWHDPSTGSRYALACELRTDGVWRPVPQSGHFSGLAVATGIPCPPPPPPPSPAPSPPTPPTPPASVPACSLNGESKGSADCTCDPGWIGDNCGQLDLLPAPPLEAQVVPIASVAIDNAVANATWGMSVVGPLDDGLYHGYTTEIANECMLMNYGNVRFCVHAHTKAILGFLKYL